MSDKPLNSRQEAFVRLYMAGEDGVRGNVTRAATVAGYSERTAASQGQRLLKHAKVATLIAHLRATALEESGAKLRDWMLLVPEAQETLLDVMRLRVPSKLADSARKAANDVLDRALGKVPTRMQITGELTIEALLDATDDDGPGAGD